MTSRPIAVIGLSGRYPGGAQTLDQLWANLKAGVDGVTDLPEGRWDRGYQHPDKDRKGRSYTYAGGYLDQVDGFDADFFGMSPREAAQMDPQHRLLLELAWEACEDAGVLPASLAGTRTGVYVGLSSRDYGDLSGDVTADQGINAYTNLGLSLSLASNRISYVLDLKGPSFTVDTACSSGMVALHQARQAMLSGECDMALVGAANMLLSPRPGIGFSKASMLSPAGRCTSFDANGAGYVRAEGGGMLLLKPLDAAERDGDPILGVIVASGVNSDGRTVGIALPNKEAQAALLNEVYGNAGIAPDEVFYLEAHGTGTAVGDPIECEAIARALGGARRSTPLHIGSIKSNIGHLEPAAGIAGITKVLLALKHGELPANLHFHTPNPKIDFDGWKLRVVDQPTPLPQTDRPVVMGVNSFGFGGTNGHAVVRQYRGAGRETDTPRAAPWTSLLVLSAQSEAGLAAVAAQWQRLLDDTALHGTDAASRWNDLRAAALHGRTLHTHRLALHAESAAGAAQALAAHARGDSAPGLATGKAPANGLARVAWVYGGNGPQWWAMGRDLLDGDATYRAAVEEVDALFAQLAGWSLIDELRRDEATSRMAQTEVAQPTLFALQVGLTAVLRAAGLQPDAVYGHSVGEVAAAWASGALSLAQATFVIHHRSAAQGTTAGLGRMAALGVPAEQARALIGEIGGFLELAAVNSPSAVTVAGDAGRLAALVQRLTDAGSFARVLALDYAFHTGAMDGIQARLARSLAGLAPGATAVPFISTVEGREVDGRTLDATYWWRNVREPVAFEAATTHALEALQIGAFVEIGPHPVLRDYLMQCAKARSVPATALVTLRRPRADKPEPEAAAMWQAIAAAYAGGLGDARRLSAPPGRRVTLPLYPWQRSRHWRGENLLPGIRALVKRDHPLLGWRLSPVGAVWENFAETHLLPYLADHVIEDAAVFPAAGYIEQGLAAAAQLRGPNEAAATQLEDFDILKPCVIPAGPAPVMQVQVDVADGTFEITSRAQIESSDTTLHARGRFTQAEASHRPACLDIAAAWQALPVEVDRDAHYAGANRRGLHYGPAFQAVRELRTSSHDDDALHAAAWIELPESASGELAKYTSHPVLLDGCLQTLITLLGQREARACAYIPVRVGRLRSFGPLPRRLFCTVRLLRQTDRSGSAEFMLYDEDGHCLQSLEGTRFQKVDFGSAGGALRLVEHWQRDAGHGGVSLPIALPSPTAVLASLPAVPAGDARPMFDALAALYAAESLRVLWAMAGFEVAATATPGALQRRARIVAEQAPLFRALVEMAVSDGWLAATDTGLRWATTPRPAPAALWQQQLLDSPAHAAELMLLAQLGENLPALLRGEAEPLRPSAAERGHPQFESLFDTAPWRAASHARAAEALRALVAAWPAARPLRVLELHAGGGGLTAAVLPTLPVLRSAYTLTDRDADVVDRLAHRHAAVTHVQAMPLDLADDAQLAAHRGAHDVLLCGDGLLGCGLPPEQALKRARSLLVPGGVMLLIAPSPSRLATLLFGQAPAWWRDEMTPLRDADAWAALWREADWPESASVVDRTAQQTFWIARAGTAEGIPAAPPADTPVRRWLLLTDTSEANEQVATQLAQALQRSGQIVRCQRVHDAADAGAHAADSVAVDDLAAFGGWLQSPLDVVVQLAGLASEALPVSEQVALQQLRCTPVLTLLQAMKADGPDIATRARPRLRVVTRRAFMAPAADASLNPAQVPVWGLARVLSNEHADLAPKMIDLHLALDAAAAERLADELLREDGETEVLLDAGGRWLHRVAQATPASLALEAASLPAVGSADAGHAVRLDTQAQGGLDTLHLRRVPRRTPAAGEVEVAVRAAGLNFRDVLWAMNMLPEEAVEAGFSGATIGMECAGEVVAVGAGVQGLAVGDRVIGFASGCFASHVTTDAGALAKMPAGLGWEEAATVPTTFLTAMYALDHLARLEPGERVLIHGAAGGVGLAAVQIAKLRGAVVFGTAGNDDKRRLLRLCGVDHVLDSRSLTYADDVMALTAGEGVDVVLNSLAGEAITKNLQILRPFGRMLEIGKRDFYANSRIGLRPFRNNLSYFGIDADTLLVERPALARKVFAQVAALFAQRKLHPLPFQALPIDRAAQAFRLMQQSRHVGKIVVTLPRQVAAATAGVAPAWQPASEGTWLVTGGLGGFGLASAKWLAALGVRHLALVSRRGAATDEARDGIAAIEALGCRVRSYAADVGDGAALARVLAEVRATQPPLRGVLHSAMVLDDGPVLTLTGARLTHVMQPKIAGAWHLHELTKGDRLASFIVYSSATTVVGNPGQGNYVAANLYLESLVQLRRAQGLPGMAVAWGAIRDVGVLTRGHLLDSQLQQRSGLAAVPSQQALAEMGRMLAADATVVSLAQFNVQRLTEMLPLARTPRFERVAPRRGAEAGGVARQTLAERLSGVPAGERRPLVLDTLREQLGRILGTSAAKIDLERQLPDLGLDSLMAVELAQALEVEVGRPVSVMQMIQASSGMAVAELLLAGFETPAHA